MTKFISDSCLPENVRAAHYVVLSFSNCSWMHVANGICTNSLMRSSHDFSVPWAKCLFPCCSFPHLKLWLKLCSKCHCTDFWQGVSISSLTFSLSSLIPVTWNLYCAAYSVKLISLTVNVRAASLGKRKPNYFANLYSGCMASGHRLCGDLTQKTLQAQVHCAGRINKFIQVWINTLGSCYSGKEGGMLEQAYWREITIFLAAFSLF